VAERSKAAVLKTADGASRPGVRIPSPPPVSGTIDPAPPDGVDDSTDDSPPAPRASVLATLARDLGALAAAGDLDGYRILTETIGRLLAPPAAVRVPSDVDPFRPLAAVVDLAAERERRGR
jgi:hypothetical protein